mgnify:CR=1 FL=1
MSIDDERTSVYIVEYDAGTGKITTTATLNILQVVEILATKANWLIGRGSLDEHYVDLATKEIRLRGPCPAELTGSTLTNVPAPSSLTWRHDSGSGGVINVTDSAVDLDFGLPGTYQVTIEAVAYLPRTYEIVVSEVLA